MGYFSNVKKQYWIAFFHALIPAYVIERLFWQQRGMTVPMVIGIEILYALVVTLCEIPSGILADKLGRKRLLIADDFLAVAELVILLFAHHFWHFAVSIVLAGVGRAFSSGSTNALLYDSLLVDGRQKEFEKHLGRIGTINFAGGIIAALSGSVLAGLFNFELNYMLSVCSMGIAFVITLSLREPPCCSSEREPRGMRQYIKQATSIFIAKPMIALYCLTGAVLGACMTYLDEFWQIVVDSIHIPIYFFGIISAAAALLRIPGNLLAYKLKEKFSYKAVFSCVIAISALGYASIFATRNILCLIPMMLLFAIAGVVDPLALGYLHHHTDSSIRATVESFASLGLRVAAMAIGGLFGLITAKYSIFAGFLLLGIVCAVYLVFFRFVAKKAARSH